MAIGDEQSAASYLATLTPGKLPLSIFIEVARLTVTPIIELVPLRHRETGLEVLLLERPEDDPIWAGQLHTPGTVVRASDRKGSFAEAFDRLLEGELAGAERLGDPVFVTTRFHDVQRGAELAHIYTVELAESGEAGSFYPVKALPSRLVASQKEFILEAAAHVLSER